MRNLLPVFIALIATAALAAGTSDLTPLQFASVESYLRSVELKGQIPRQYVHVIAPSGAKQGQMALAVLYTHEDPNGLGGNAYEQKLAVFLRDGARLSAPIDVVVGGKFNRGMKLREATPEQVTFDSMNYGPNDAPCCPSTPGVVVYRLSEGAMVEAGSPNSALQRTGGDKVLARGQRPGNCALPASSMRRRAAAELGS